MAELKYVKCRVEEQIGIATINNPPVNALASYVFADLKQAMEQFLKDDAVRVIVLTGEGNCFAAGADIKEILKIERAEQGEQLGLKGHELLDVMDNADKPIIGAINGPCLGGGNELAMACHFRIASDKARFGQPEINLGIIPGLGGTQRFPRLIGVSKAIEYLLTGDMITPTDAKELGLVNTVVPDYMFQNQLMGLCKKIASKSRVTVAPILKAVREGMKMDLKSAMKMEAKMFGEAMMTADKKEGVAAFLEKRPAKFQDK